MTANLINEDAFNDIFSKPRPTAEEQQVEALEQTIKAARCAGCNDECECETAEMIRREGE